ncbi:MAG: hypothetical protein WC998_05505 [Candidatus Paceibacterota bacterium]|jgi:hypothetical protein
MTKKHVIRTPIDEALLQEMKEAGEISFTRHGHVVGMDGFILRAWKGMRKKNRGESYEAYLTRRGMFK